MDYAFLDKFPYLKIRKGPLTEDGPWSVCLEEGSEYMPFKTFEEVLLHLSTYS